MIVYDAIFQGLTFAFISSESSGALLTAVTHCFVNTSAVRTLEIASCKATYMYMYTLQSWTEDVRAEVLITYCNSFPEQSSQSVNLQRNMFFFIFSGFNETECMTVCFVSYGRRGRCDTDRCRMGSPSTLLQWCRALQMSWTWVIQDFKIHVVKFRWLLNFRFIFWIYISRDT